MFVLILIKSLVLVNKKRGIDIRFYFQIKIHYTKMDITLLGIRYGTKLKVCNKKCLQYILYNSAASMECIFSYIVRF